MCSRVGEDRRQEFRRVLQEAETHLTRAAKVEDNGHILDLMALYAAYMHIARDSTEVWAVLNIHVRRYLTYW